MAKGSSWMKAKRAKMASPLYRERFLSNTEGEKPCFARHETIGAANAARDETQRLVDEYLKNDGRIKRIACTGESPKFGKTSVSLGDGPGRAGLKYSRHWGRAW